MLNSEQYMALQSEVHKRHYPFIEGHTNSFVIQNVISSGSVILSLYGELFQYPITFSLKGGFSGLPTIDEITEALIGQEIRIRDSKPDEVHLIRVFEIKSSRLDSSIS